MQIKHKLYTKNCLDTFLGGIIDNSVIKISFGALQYSADNLQFISGFKRKEVKISQIFEVP